MSAAFPKASKRASQRRAAIQSACLHQHRPNEGSAGPNPIYEGFTWLTDLLPRGNQPTNIFILINLQVLQVENICLPSPFFLPYLFSFFLSLSLFSWLLILVVFFLLFSLLLRHSLHVFLLYSALFHLLLSFFHFILLFIHLFGFEFDVLSSRSGQVIRTLCLLIEEKA